MNSSLFSQEELKSLDRSRLPKHIAIIPDGNRRWAKNKTELPTKGYSEGACTLINTVKAAKEIGISTISFFLFSTENWNRSKEEISMLMWLFEKFLIDNRELMCTLGVKFETIGDLGALPKSVREEIAKTKVATCNCSSINMLAALNYGGRDEMRRALVKIVEETKQGKLQPEEITEELIGKHMDTATWGDPELFIRTSGEARVSNFLLWQLAYCEIHFTNVLWPDFKPAHLLRAIIDFQTRIRRWGGS